MTKLLNLSNLRILWLVYLLAYLFCKGHGLERHAGALVLALMSNFFTMKLLTPLKGMENIFVNHSGVEYKL